MRREAAPPCVSRLHHSIRSSVLFKDEEQLSTPSATNMSRPAASAMPPAPNQSQVLVVLYQSCPCREHVRHTALRALCLLFFVYSLVAAIICATGTIASLEARPVVISAAVLICAGTVLGGVSLGFRVHHEKARVRDDVERAGVSGDVRAQIANLKATARTRDPDRLLALETAQQLLMLEYEGRKYWCVPSRRPAGDMPSADECVAARARETRRRRHDMDIGKAYFAMAVTSCALCLASSVLITTREQSGDYVHKLSPTSVLMPLIIIATIALAAACVLIPKSYASGHSLAVRIEPVPAGLVSVTLTDNHVNSAPDITTDAVPQYQEALPGPPLEELGLDDELVVSPQQQPADREAPAAEREVDMRAERLEEENGATDVDIKKKDAKKTHHVWVWGGFTKNASPAVIASEPTATGAPRDSGTAAEGTRENQLSLRATAPPLDDDSDCSTSMKSSRLQGNL